jgi:hypothetical protein
MDRAGLTTAYAVEVRHKAEQDCFDCTCDKAPRTV